MWFYISMLGVLSCQAWPFSTFLTWQMILKRKQNSVYLNTMLHTKKSWEKFISQSKHIKTQFRLWFNQSLVLGNESGSLILNHFQCLYVYWQETSFFNNKTASNIETILYIPGSEETTNRSKNTSEMRRVWHVYSSLLDQQWLKKEIYIRILRFRSLKLVYFGSIEVNNIAEEKEGQCPVPLNNIGKECCTFAIRIILEFLFYNSRPWSLWSRTSDLRISFQTRSSIGCSHFFWRDWTFRTTTPSTIIFSLTLFFLLDPKDTNA